MKRETCESVEPRLVDYADETLEPVDRQCVADHMARCPACRDTLDGLQRSLGLAQIIWEDNLSSGYQAAWAKAHPARIWRYVAAAAVVVLGVGLVLNLHDRPGPEPAEPEVTIAQIERQIFDAASAAKVLAAAELLAKRSEAGDLTARPYRYVIENYPQTNAAAIARTRIQ